MVPEVLRLDDERVPLPAATRRSHPLTDAAMRPAVERNDPRVVDHLVDDRHVRGVLDDLHVVVVRTGHHRRSRVEADKAPLVDREILRAGWWTLENRGPLGAPLLPLRRVG